MGVYENPRNVSRLTRQTLALVLAGGRGARLLDLTRWRPEAALFFGGKFRIIDFTLSNCINSGIRRVGVLTQYMAHPLIRHLINGWSFLRSDFGEFVEALPASQRTSEEWYKGTADAVFQNLDLIRIYQPDLVLILASDQIYKMDYGPMLSYHAQHSADLTVACLEVPVNEARRTYGVLACDDHRRITAFDEKPEQPKSLPNRSDKALASMGIYVFNTKFLYEQLIRDADTPGSSRDFARDIIPAVIDKYRVLAYPFHDPATGKQPYWRDVGTVDMFWQANMELIGVSPELNLYDVDWPILTHQRQLPPAKFVFDDDGRRGMAVDSMVSGGCIISGARVRHSLLFSKVQIHSYAEVENSVVLPGVDIGRRCRIRNAVIESGVSLPPDTIIGYDRQEDARRYHVTPGGIVLVAPDSYQENHSVD